jgi:hypothetical protein
VRWLRKFDTTGSEPQEIEVGPEPLHGLRPTAGSNVELTRVEIAGRTVWTFGFEAFGELADLKAVSSVLAALSPPPLGLAVLSNYPEWLSNALADS